MRKDTKSIRARTAHLTKLAAKSDEHIKELKSLATEIPDKFKSAGEEDEKAKEMQEKSAQLTDPMLAIVDWYNSLGDDTEMSNT